MQRLRKRRGLTDGYSVTLGLLTIVWGENCLLKREILEMRWTPEGTLNFKENLGAILEKCCENAIIACRLSTFYAGRVIHTIPVGILEICYAMAIDHKREFLNN